MTGPSVIRKALAAILLALLTISLATWWGSRSDTLFGTKRWLAGKDTGKYLFYTYDFLFRPLGEGVTLTADMGFQEILLREPEGPRRVLEGVTARVWVEPGSYLWVELHRVGEACLAIRLSRKGGYRGGWSRFDSAGAVLEEHPWEDATPAATDGWHRLEARLEMGSWRVTLDGRTVGAVPDAGQGAGRLGFRGSGPLTGRVRVRDVDTSWTDPAGGRRWTEHDRLASGPASRGVMVPAAAVALGFLLLRHLARGALLTGARPDRRGRAVLLSDAALALPLMATMYVPVSRTGLVVPGVVLVSSLVDLAILAWAGGPPEGAGRRRAPARSIAVAALVGAAVLAGVARHGATLFRGTTAGPPTLRDVHPDSYRLTPPDDGREGEFVLDAPVTLEPGRPLFSGSRLFREQVIEVEAELPKKGALDLVFQSRSFTTAGDPGGEELPWGRRLLRLSADPSVPDGLSRMTGARPAPFWHLTAKPPAVPTLVRVVVDGNEVTASVNEVVTRFSRVSSLGRGETGLMAWGGPVTVRSMRVRPLGREGKAWTRRSQVLLALAILLVAVAMMVLVFPRTGMWFQPAGLPCLGAFFPLGLYFLGALSLSTGDLALLARGRLGWQDLLLLASLVQAAGGVLLLRGRLRRPALAFNLLLALCLGAAVLAGWDLLPDNHPLRLRFAGEAMAPASTGTRRARGARPWYADMNAIGAGLFAWKQTLGGEAITRDKPPGEIRVLVVGGSQAWGSGAASSGETFAELLERRLRARGLPARVWNGGVSGAGTQQVAATYLGLLRNFRPDVVVADLGLNDSTALFRDKDAQAQSARMAASLSAMAAACRADGADLLLVSEPMSMETGLRPADGHYAALAAAVREQGFGVIDPVPLMAAEERRGMVWWDTAHLTPRGHGLMAGFLEGAVAALVARRAERVDVPSPGF